jgi:DNA-directed RNA polymerase specialized sigma24 family protein
LKGEGRFSYSRTTSENNERNGNMGRRDDFVDYFEVAENHLAVHQRLTDWARWVRVRPHGWQVAPMFRQARSNSFQWHPPEARASVNVPEALEIEKAVSLLPEKNRDALRWCYVFPGNPAAMARKLGVSARGLMELVSTGRTMLKNVTN